MLNQSTTKNSIPISIVLILLAAAVPSVEAAQGTGDLAITNAIVIDGTGAGPLEGATVIVRDGKIESVSGDGSIPEGFRLIDLEGRYLLPGLIDPPRPHRESRTGEGGSGLGRDDGAKHGRR